MDGRKDVEKTLSNPQWINRDRPRGAVRFSISPNMRRRQNNQRGKVMKIDEIRRRAYSMPLTRSRLSARALSVL